MIGRMKLGGDQEAGLLELPCGDYLIVLHGPDGSRFAADNEFSGPAYHLMEEGGGYTLLDPKDGRRFQYPTMRDGLTAGCRLCGDPRAPCKDDLAARGLPAPEAEPIDAPSARGRSAP